MLTDQKLIPVTGMTSERLARRTLLKGVALAGAAMACPMLLAGCGRPCAASTQAAGTTGPASAAAATLEQKIAQMLLVGFRGTALDASNHIVRDIRDHRIGGVVLFDRDAVLKSSGRNIVSPEQLKALTAALRALTATPLFIAVDQEGGNVCRLKESQGFPPTVTAQHLGTVNDANITRMHADRISATLAEHGLNLNFAPVADLNVNPGSPAIGALQRSFSANPEIVTNCAEIFIEAHDRKRVATCLKHFPGHGSAAHDSHLGFVDVTATWSARELEPYRRLISAGRCRMIMTAHVFNRTIDPDLPATLSFSCITGILRQRLAFGGVVVSDDLQMQGLAQLFDYRTIVEKSILAGVDILLVGNNLSYDPEVVPRTISLVADLVRAGRLSAERIDESYRRIMALKGWLAGG
jgi:beta-N-acetylhexosaminidase